MEWIAALILTYRYWIIIPLTFLEGPIIAFAAGSLAALGYFNPWVLLIVFLIRDVLSDIAYYFFGRYGWNTKFVQGWLKRMDVTDEDINDIRPMWINYPTRTLFFSKFAYGVAAALIVVAGALRMPFWVFIVRAGAIALVQYGGLLLLGYFFGNAFSTVSDVLTWASLLIGGVFLFTIGWHIFQRRMRSKVIKKPPPEGL